MADDTSRKGKAADFTVETVGKNLQALIDEGYTEDKDSPRSVIMTLYPQIREAMDRLGLSVRQVYRGLKGKMPLPMTEKTFHTYVQQAKAEYERTQAQGEAKPKRGRPPKRIEKLARDLTYMAVAHEALKEAAAEKEREADPAAMPGENGQEPDAGAPGGPAGGGAGEREAPDAEAARAPEAGAAAEKDQAQADGDAEPAKAERPEARYERSAAERNDEIEELAARLEKGQGINNQ